MASRKTPPPIEVEDASQLSILAYQVKTNPKSFDVKKFLQRLKSDHARHIARVIAGEREEVGEETLRQADYYLRWADETARTAREASRRPGRR